MRLLLVLILFFAAAQGVAAQTEILMTAEGFSPREVSVAAGTLVRFVNADTVPRYPASNVHPTHSLYPAFDPQRSIAPGEAWEFRFDAPGTWRYHDHLLPHRTGTIIVQGSVAPRVSWWEAIRRRVAAVLWQLVHRRQATSASADPSAEEFRKMEESTQYRHVETMLDRVGAAQTWWYVMSAFAPGVGREGNAHDVAHFFGEKLFATEGIPGMNHCTPDFAFGCYHGFAQAALTEGLALLDRLAQTCQRVGALGSGPWASCIHGLGHGVATYYDTVELGSALTTCDQVEAGQAYCYDGVFMEFATNAPPSVFTPHQTSPLSLCRGLKTAYHFACGRNLPALYSRQFSLPPEGVAPFCEKEINDMEIQRGCIEGIGLHIGQTSRGLVAAITEGCRIVQDPARYAACVTAAAGELVFQNAPGWRQSAAAACRGLSTAFIDQCLTRIARLALDYGR